MREDPEFHDENMHNGPTASEPTDHAVNDDGTSSLNSDTNRLDNQRTSVYCLPSQQLTYEPFPINTYQTLPDGRKSSGSVECWNSMRLALPWSPGGPEEVCATLICEQIPPFILMAMA